MRGIESMHLAIGLAQWRHGGEEFTRPDPAAAARDPPLRPRLRAEAQGPALPQPRARPRAARAVPHHARRRRLRRARRSRTASSSRSPSSTGCAVSPRTCRGSTCSRGSSSRRSPTSRRRCSPRPTTSTPRARRAGRQPARARRTIEGAFNPVDAVAPGRAAARHRHPAARRRRRAGERHRADRGRQLARREDPPRHRRHPDHRQRDRRPRRAAQARARREPPPLQPRRHRPPAHRRSASPGLAVTPRTLRRDLIQSIGRNEKADAAAGDARSTTRSCACARCCSTTAPRSPAATRCSGVSVLDALGELARLVAAADAAVDHRAARPRAPSNRSRTTGRAAADAADRAGARSASSGTGPTTRPGTARPSPRPPRRNAAHELAKRLHRAELPRLLERAKTLIGQTRMRPFESIAELGVYLRLLLDVRETLDKFQPAVFDRSLAELIAATAHAARVARDVGANRRRLRKLAREYVRPGVHVTDLNESLRRIQQQRILWQRFAAAGVVPEVPIGIADVQVAYQRVAEDLGALDVPLRRTGTPQLALACSRSTSCSRQIAGLAAESRGARQPAGAHRPARRAARPQARPAALRPVAPARARDAGRAPSSSSPGGSPCSRRCSHPTARCSAPTPACSTGSRPTSGSSTRRTPPPPGSCWPGSSPRPGRSASSTGPTRPPR